MKKKHNKNFQINIALLSLLALVLASFLLYPYFTKKSINYSESSTANFVSNLRYSDNFDVGSLDDVFWDSQKTGDTFFEVKNGKIEVSLKNPDKDKLKLVFNKEINYDFRTSMDLDLNNFESGKFSYNLYGDLDNPKYGFRVEIESFRKTSNIRVLAVLNGEENVVGAKEIANDKMFNLKVARLGTTIYFGVDKGAIGTMDNIYEGKVKPSIVVNKVDDSQSESLLAIDNIYIEEPF